MEKQVAILATKAEFLVAWYEVLVALATVSVAISDTVIAHLHFVMSTRCTAMTRGTYF